MAFTGLLQFTQQLGICRNQKSSRQLKYSFTREKLHLPPTMLSSLSLSQVRHRVSKVRTISLKKWDGNPNKRKISYENTVVRKSASDYTQGGFQKSMDEDTSNRSSSGSAVSNSEFSADASFMQFYAFLCIFMIL